MEDEKLKLSKLYKKGYNHADLIVTQMPERLKDMHVPEGEPSEYTQGFTDRVREFEIERDSIKGFSVNELKEKYGDHLDRYNKDKPKGLDKE